MLYSRDWFETDRYCWNCDYSRAEHQLADVLRPGDDVFADVVEVVDRHLGRRTAKKDLFVVDGASHYDLYDQPKKYVDQALESSTPSTTRTCSPTPQRAVTRRPPVIAAGS